MTRATWAAVILAAIVAGPVAAIVGYGWELSALEGAVVGAGAGGSFALLVAYAVNSPSDTEPPARS